MRIKNYFAKNLFAGKTVFVTGGAGTINRGIAAGFGALGARVVLGGRTEKTLEEAALDKYEFMREAYLQRRRNLVHDGNPPKKTEDEDTE